MSQIYEALYKCKNILPAQTPLESKLGQYVKKDILMMNREKKKVTKIDFTNFFPADNGPDF